MTGETDELSSCEAEEWTVVPVGAVAAQYLQTFKDYPPSQKGGSFGIEQILQKVEASLSARGH
jgi:hypothetical protein